MKNKTNKISNIKKLHYHDMLIDDVFSSVDSSINGLSDEQVATKKDKYGLNKLPEKKQKTIFELVYRELINPIILLLLVATAFSFIAGELLDGFVIIVIILVDIIMGVAQEKKAERVALSLSKMIPVKVKALRNGEKMLINSENVTIGDIIFLESGDKVSADMRIISCFNLKVNESILTGESIDAEKIDTKIDGVASLAERKNMLYAGTTVSSGRAMAVVVNIGINTEIGNIAEKLSQSKDETSPLNLRIKDFSKKITIAVGVVALVIFLVLYLQGYEFKTIFLSVVALSVSAIPEGLPLAVTITLSISSNKMGKNNVIVKNLSAVESLGSCTVIASDKTGTLTINEQTAKIVVLSNGDRFSVQGSGYNDEGEVVPMGDGKLSMVKELAELGAINNEAKLYKHDNNFSSFGDSIDIAFLALAMKMKIDNNAEVVLKIPYESEKKYSAVFYKNEEKLYCSAKGSIEKILSFCSTMNIDGQSVPLDKDFVLVQHEELASEGYRLIAIAKSECSDANESEIKNMTFLGFVGFIDPIRLESKNAVLECKNAGIKVIMITGDHPLTAYKIASDIEIATNKDQVATGEEIEKYYALGLKQFDKFIKDKTVFARVTPTDKFNIIESLKRNGEFVAVTGDGVNDAPAIKSAHIGIAMGSGTDVAKESADMIISDDNFNSIVKGVKEGRTAYSNIRKVTYLLLSSAFAEILFYFISVILGLPVPLLASQLLYVNIVTNGFQDLALAFEKGEDKLMKEYPRSTKQSLFSKSLIVECVVSGIYIGLVILVSWIYMLKVLNLDVVVARSITMALMVFFENFHALNCRSETQSIFKIPVFSNKLFLFSIVSATILQVTLMEVAVLSNALGLTSVNYLILLSILVFSTSIIGVMEIYKFIIRKYRKKHKITSAY